MKKSFLLLLVCVNMALPSCKKSADVRPELSVTDLLEYYFVLETTAGNLRVDYFYMENNELKGLRDGLDYRRGLENIVLSGDTLRYNIQGGSGPNTYKHVLKKENGGNLTLVEASTTMPDLVSHCEIQPVASATSFISSQEDGDESKFRFQTEVAEAALFVTCIFRAGQLWMPTNNWAPFYTLDRNIGWKGHSEKAFGVAVSTWMGDDSVDMLIQSPLISQAFSTADGIKLGRKVKP